MFTLSNVWSYGEIYAGSRHLAIYSYGSTNFLHTDWLGSKRVMTSLSAVNSETCSSLPFGDGFTCTSPDYDFNHFTDDIHDSESNLEHTQFRKYSSTQGRFTTTDPFGGSMDLGNPQSLNRYAYVLNDPLNSTDPTGLDDLLVLDPCSGFVDSWIADWGGDSFCPDRPVGVFDGGDSAFGGGGGISIGIDTSGFGGLPIPGCLLPGACPVQFPWPSIADLIPRPPSPCNNGWIIVEMCNDQGSAFNSNGSPQKPAAVCTCTSDNATPRNPNSGPGGFCDYTCDCSQKHQTFTTGALARSKDARCQGVKNACPKTISTALIVIDTGIYKEVLNCTAPPTPTPTPTPKPTPKKKP